MHHVETMRCDKEMTLAYLIFEVSPRLTNAKNANVYREYVPCPTRRFIANKKTIVVHLIFELSPLDLIML